MGWIARTPSLERIELWGGTAQGGAKVAMWPHPNTVRIDPMFRMVYTSQVMIPVASRYGFYYHINGTPFDRDVPESNAFGWFDFETFEANRVGVSIPENEWGYSAEIEFESLDDEGDPPNVRWIEVTIELTKAGDTQLQSGRFIFNPPASAWRRNHNTALTPPAFPGWKLDQLPASFPFWLKCEIFSVSECYVFEEEDVGMASFNGVDAFIGLDHNTVIHNGPHFLEADVRMRQLGLQAILGREASASIWGTDDPDGRWSIVTLSDVGLPPLNTWFKYRQEFEWSSGEQLKYEIYIDDVLTLGVVSVRVNTFWRNLGVARRTLFPAWGDFDLKNLVYKTGSFASPVTRLDMPLIKNALDLSPDANHGTTFNMDLPSV